MKKSSLALMMMGLIASSATQAAEVYNKNGNKLDVYGKVKAMHYMSDYDSKDGDQTYVRFGIKGETQINDDLTGYGRWESEFSGNKTESDSSQKTRLAFAGVKVKNYGSFDYGRNLGALYDVEAWTDMFPEFGGDSSAQTDNFMTKRASGLATYRNTDFFGTRIAAIDDKTHQINAIRRDTGRVLPLGQTGSHLIAVNVIDDNRARLFHLLA